MVLESNMINRAWTLPTPGSGVYRLNLGHKAAEKLGVTRGQFNTSAATHSLEFTLGLKAFRVIFADGTKTPHRLRLDPGVEPLARLELQKPDEAVLLPKNRPDAWVMTSKDRAAAWRATVTLMQHLDREFVAFGNHLHIVKHAAAAD